MLETFIFLTLVVALVATIAYLGRRGFFWAEQIIIGIGVLLQFYLFGEDWGNLRNVHQGFLNLILIGVIGALLFLGELIVIVSKPSTWREVHILFMALVPIILIVVGYNFGG